MKKLPERKTIRLTEYDYSANGAYFITICTRDRQCILSRVVGDGALDVPKIELSAYGTIVDNEIKKSNNIYENIKIEKYIIMPNHIHMILVANADKECGTSRAPSPTNAIVPSFVSMLKRFTNKNAGISLWQRNYYDHIIRNEHDYREIWQYIDTNPAKWKQDAYYTEN